MLPIVGVLGLGLWVAGNGLGAANRPPSMGLTGISTPGAGAMRRHELRHFLRDSQKGLELDK